MLKVYKMCSIHVQLLLSCYLFRINIKNEIELHRRLMTFLVLIWLGCRDERFSYVDSFFETVLILFLHGLLGVNGGNCSHQLKTVLTLEKISGLIGMNCSQIVSFMQQNVSKAGLTFEISKFI